MKTVRKFTNSSLWPKEIKERNENCKETCKQFLLSRSALATIGSVRSCYSRVIRGTWGMIQQRSSSRLFCGRPLWAVPAWALISSLWCCPFSISCANHSIALLWCVACRNHVRFHLLTVARRGSCGPTGKLIVWQPSHMCTALRSLVSFAGKMIHSMVAHLDSVTSLAVDPNGLYLLSGSMFILNTLWISTNKHENFWCA